MSFWGPPAFKAFFYPLLNAIVAGGLGFGLGYVVGVVSLAKRPDMTGWATAWVVAALVWTFDHFSWQSIVERSWQRIVEAEEEAAAAARERAMGSEAAPAQPVRVLVTSEDRRRGEYVNLPAREGQLYQFAAGVLEGKPASYRLWAKGNGPFTETEFSNLLAEMVNRGMATRGGGGQVEITAAGRHVLAGVLEGRLSPTERETLLDDGWKPFDTTRQDGSNGVGE
jgi:hypothetical protein